MADKHIDHTGRKSAGPTRSIFPVRCCPMGTYSHTVSMPIAGRVAYVDLCIADLVACLNAGNLRTTESCCGHGKQDGYILLEDGRELVIRRFEPKG